LGLITGGGGTIWGVPPEGDQGEGYIPPGGPSTKVSWGGRGGVRQAPGRGSKLASHPRNEEPPVREMG